VLHPAVYTARVPLAPGTCVGLASSIDCLCRRCVLSWRWRLIRADTSQVAATRRPLHTPDRLIRHARPHGRCDGVVPPARHAGARYPIERVGSSSEDRLEFEGDQAETPAADRQGQMRTDLLGVKKWQRVPGRPADRLCQRRVFPGGYVPGATDGSNPVGYVRLFIQLF
jgi:hypothetical protein